MRYLIYVVLLLIVAGAIAYGLDAISVKMLPQNISSVMTKPYSLGVRALGIHISICGVIGLICSHALLRFIFKK